MWLFKKKKERKKKENKHLKELSRDDSLFVNRHATDDSNIIFGKNQENKFIGVTANTQTSGLTFITNDINNAYKTVASATLNQKNLSYVIYDPNKIAYEMCAENLCKDGYDVRVVDFAKTEDRIDPFETANIVSNAFWTASMIAQLVGSPDDEIEGTTNLLLGMMQYLMDKKEKIKIEDMMHLFEDIHQLKVDTMKELAMCVNSRDLIKTFLMQPQDRRTSILTRLKTKFFNIVEPHANLFAVTTTSKKTALFITNCPKEKELLAAMLLFNIRNISIFVGNGEVNTLLIDDVSSNWYPREILIDITKKSETRLGKGCAALDFVTELGEFNNHIVVYDSTESDATKNIIRQCINTNNENTEEVELNKTEDRAENNSDVLNSVLNHLVVIDIDDVASTFICNKLE